MQYLYVKNGDAVEQVERVCRSGFVVSPHGPDAFISDFLAATSDCQIHVISRGRRIARFQHAQIVAETRNGGSGPIQRIWYRTFFAVALVRRIVGLRPDRILCGSTGSQLLVCWLVGKMLGIDVVHSRHNSLRERTGNPLNNLRRWFEARLLRRVHAVVVHGPYLKAQVVDAGVPGDRVFQFEVSFPDAPEKPQPTSRDIVLYVGRIEVAKGILDLLHAAKPLLAQDRRRVLYYVGRGSGMDVLNGEIAQLGLQDRVEVKGPVPHDEVMAIMRDAFVVVTPTRTVFPEGRCMVVLESLVAGIPVIAPNHGPFPFAVTHEGNGLLYDSDSVPALSGALRRMFDDTQLRQSLREGAARSSRQLRQSESRFSSAVHNAFRFGTESAER